MLGGAGSPLLSSTQRWHGVAPTPEFHRAHREVRLWSLSRSMFALPFGTVYMGIPLEACRVVGAALSSQQNIHAMSRHAIDLWMTATGLNRRKGTLGAAVISVDRGTPAPRC